MKKLIIGWSRWGEISFRWAARRSYPRQILLGLFLGGVLLGTRGFGETLPPFNTGFESAQGYTSGNLAGQDGWLVPAGSAVVTDEVALAGTFSVGMPFGSTNTNVTHSFAEMAGAVSTWVDCYVRPTVTWTLAETTMVMAEGSGIGLIRVDSAGHFVVFNGDGNGGGRWIVTGRTVALNGSGQALGWVRITIRQDYSTQKWDLYIDGQMALQDMGLRDNTKTYFSQFSLVSASIATAYFESFYLGPVCPLFTDSDNDGMDDAWEMAHGLNAALNDRNSDLDSDGLTNIEEYALWTNPNQADTDDDGMPDSWEIEHGPNPLVNDAATDPGEVGRTVLQSYQQSLSPWPTATVGDGLQAWFRADKGVTKDAANKVSQWLDMSGHGVRVIQTADTARQPLWVASAMNGLPVVGFDGATALRTAGLLDLQSGETDVTVIAVVMPGATQGYIATISYWGTDGDQNYGLSGEGTANRFAMKWQDGAGNLAVSPNLDVTAGQVQILCAVKNDTATTAYLNGALQGSYTMPGTMGQLLSPVGLGNAASPYHGFNGQIAEVLIYNRALSDMERTQVEGALLARYIDPDSDADGLPDAWEDQWLGTRNYGPTDDPGNVGRTLLQSYQQSLSPWPLPTVASGLRAWYRADRGVTKDGSNNISQWADVSGHGFHVVQTVEAARQPVWTGSALNSQPAVQYDDNLRVLKTPGLVDLRAGENDMTVIAVVKPESEQPFEATLLDLDYWGSNGFRWGQRTDSTNQFYLDWMNTAQDAGQYGPGLTVTGGQVKVLVAVKNGTSALAYLNGALQATTTVQTGMRVVPAAFTLGNEAAPYYGFHGQIAEVLIYNRALTDPERQQIEAELSTKYINPDSDADGLPDAWEDRYFGTSSYGPTDDPGNVGRTALQSYQQELSPWPTATVADGLQAWYRADAGAIKDGDNKVSQWTDVSGHGFHVVQAAEPSRQPVLTANAINSQPAVQFDDTAKVLLTPGPTEVLAGANDATVIAVVKPESPAHYAGTIFYWGTDGNYNLGLSTPNEASDQYRMMWRDGTGNTQLSPALNASSGQVQVLTAIKGGATASTYINGTLQGSGEVPAAMGLLPSRLAVGNSAAPYYSFHGQIAEVLVYNRALTDPERAQIEAALMTKYGIGGGSTEDSDNNGLPDAWEQQYFGQLGVDPNADPDGDGVTNLEEYQAGSDPNDFYNGSAPVITVLTGGNGAPGSGGLLQVSVANSSGQPLVNAPVTFSIMAGVSQLAASTGAQAPLVDTLPVRSQPDGTASAYYLTPSGQSSVGTVKVQAGTASVSLIFQLATNQPPAIALTAPLDGVTLNGSANVVLVAGASDSDGTVVLVEFFADETRLGEATATPYYFVWSGAQPGLHVLTARATDNTGATSISSPVTITLGPPDPAVAFIDFEAAEGFATGELAGQQDWQGNGAGVLVEERSDAPSGQRVLRYGLVEGTGQVRRDFTPSITGGVLFADFYARLPAGSEDFSSAPKVNVGGRYISLVDNGNGEAAVWALHDYGEEGWSFDPTPAMVPLDVTGTSADWHRFTVRADQNHWDLYLDGRCIAADLPSASDSIGTLELICSPLTDGWLDHISITRTNPLFPDADGDGMDDVWEAAHGLNPAVNDRDDDLDGDGRTNLQEYQAGIDPADYYNGITPVITVLAGGDFQPGYGGQLQVQITSAGEQPLDNAPVSFSITSGVSQLAATSDGGAMPAGVVTVRTAHYGEAEAYYRTPAGQSADGTVTVRAGAASVTLVFQTRWGINQSVLFDFEAAEGYVPGPLDGQQGWTSYSEDTVVESLAGAPSGENVLRFGAGNDVFHPITPWVRDGVIFVDFQAKFAPGDYASPEFSLGSAFLSFATSGSGTAADVLTGTMRDGVSYETTGAKVALDANQTTGWHRYTLRLDYTKQRWDLYLDGNPIAADMRLGSNPLASFGVGKDRALPAWLDRIQVTGHNPLFLDADQDGMDDAWETAHGLDPTINDRDADPDNDNFANIQEYLRGADPHDSTDGDSDHNGLLDPWEMQYFGHIGVDRNADADGDGLTNRREFQLGTNPIQQDTAGDGLPDGWKVAHRLDPLVFVPPAQDTDGDGLPDRFEYLTGTDPRHTVTDSSGIPDGELDPDGDGLNNLQEFQQGTDPNDYYNGRTVTVTPLADYSEHLGPDGLFAVKVTDAEGNILVNAPVQFTTTTESLLTQNPYGSGISLSVVAPTDDDGIARVYVRPAN